MGHPCPNVESKWVGSVGSSVGQISLLTKRVSLVGLVGWRC